MCILKAHGEQTGGTMTTDTKLTVIVNPYKDDFIGPTISDSEIQEIRSHMSFQVDIVTIAQYLATPANTGVVWPYFRTKPTKRSHDVLAHTRSDIPVINDYRRWAHDWAMKYESNMHALYNRVPTPFTKRIVKSDDLLAGDLEYPIVVKGYPSGQGSDVLLCETPTQAKATFEALKLKGLLSTKARTNCCPGSHAVTTSNSTAALSVPSLAIIVQFRGSP